MKIGIDARVSGRWDSGAGRYALCLAAELASVGGHQITILAAERAAVPEGAPGVQFERTAIPVASPLQHALIPAVWRRLRVEATLTTHPYASCIFDPVPSLAMVLDLYPLHFPEQFARRAVWYYRYFFPHVARRKIGLLAISEATKRDVVQRMHVREEQITVTPLAASPGFHPVGTSLARDAVLARYGVTEPYVLYHGNKRPHKNVLTLIRAFSLVTSQLGNVKLVITGEQDATDRERDFTAIRALVEELALGDRVHFTGFVHDRDLPSLYSAALATAIPSLLEGFGLPAIESMACGTPVVGSNRGALPEVIGDAGRLVNPYIAQELATAIRDVCTDAALRRDLAARSLHRASNFSWSRTARLTERALLGAVAS